MTEGGDDLPDLLGFLVEEEPWMREGICKIEHAPPEYFILDQGRTPSKGRKYCRRCPVRRECLDYGLRTDSVGLWGGEVLGLAHRDQVELTDLSIQDARPVNLEYLVNPPPMKAHQLPLVIFGPKNPTPPEQETP